MVTIYLFLNKKIDRGRIMSIFKHSATGWFFKIFLAVAMSVFIMVGFVLDPISFKTFKTERSAVPLEDTFTVTSIYIRPITTKYFCDEKDSQLHIEIIKTEGYRFQLTSQSEPFGFSNGHRIETSSIRHTLPRDVKIGDVISIKREVTFTCLGITRSIYSPTTTFTITSPEPAGKMSSQYPPVLPQSRGEYLRVPQGIGDK